MNYKKKKRVIGHGFLCIIIPYILFAGSIKRTHSHPTEETIFSSAVFYIPTMTKRN